MYDYKGQMRKINTNNTPDMFYQQHTMQQSKPQAYYELSERPISQSRISMDFEDGFRSEFQANTRSNSQQQNFEKIIPITIKQNEQDSHKQLIIQIFTSVDKSTSSHTIKLTSQQDPLFLWVFYIKDADFINIKKEQHLKVDFKGFPSVILTYLSNLQSLKDISSQNRKGQYCILDIHKKDEASLSIIQSNQFKQSIQLSLNFRRASDQQIKNHLSKEINEWKQKYNHLNRVILQLQDQLSNRKNQIESFKASYKEEKDAYQKKMNSFEVEQKEKINQIKEKATRQYNQLLQKYQNSKQNLQAQFKEQSIRIKKENQTLINKVQNYTSKCYELQSQLKDTQTNLRIRNSQLTNIRQQNQSIKAENLQLQNTNYAQQKQLAKLSCDIESLSTQLLDKKQIISSHEHVRTSTESQIKALEEKSNQAKNKLQKAEDKLSKAMDQLTKANKQIQQYKQKYEKRKEKNKEILSCMKAQEMTVRDTKQQLQQSKKKQINLKKEIQNLEETIKDMEKKNKQIKNRLQQSNKKIEEQNDLISHYGRKLNEKNIIPRSGYPTTSNLYSGNINRDFGGLNTQSRLKYSTNNSAISEVTQKTDRVQRIQAPNIKRYTGTTPKAQKEDVDRTLSPTLSRLNQQADPQDEAQQKIRPVKFKRSAV